MGAVSKSIPDQDIRSDNGPEMTAKVARGWRAGVGAKTLYIELGSPLGERLLRKLNGKLRDELVKGEIFCSLNKARVLIEQ